MTDRTNADTSQTGSLSRLNQPPGRVTVDGEPAPAPFTATTVTVWVVPRARCENFADLFFALTVLVVPVGLSVAAPVDPRRDHIRGPQDAPVTLVEYGDFECPYCGRAEPVVRELLAERGDVRFVWRHLPVSDVRPNADPARSTARDTRAKGASLWITSNRRSRI